MVMNTTLLVPHDPLTPVVESSPSNVVDAGSVAVASAFEGKNRYTCRPGPAVPSPHGCQLSTVFLTYQTPLFL